MNTPLKLYPSSSAWALGRLCVTDSANACFRHILWRHVAPIPDGPPPELAEMGHRFEDEYFQYLTNEQPYAFHRELPFKSEISGVVVSGRLDFMVYHSKYRVPHELKASQSTKVLYGVIRKGEPKINNVAQVVNYFIHLGLDRGLLVYKYVPKYEMRKFKIEVDDAGKILIDGAVYQYTVQDQLRHQVLAAEALVMQKICDRPADAGACLYCVYKDRCTDYEGFNGTDKEFIEQLQEGET